MKGFARREFQLMLLRRMADFQPELVEAACAEMEASHAQYMAAHNRWQSMLRSKRAPRGLELYRAVLGEPDATRPVSIGDAKVTACSWRLPALWPDLRWEATVGVNDVVLHDWLVRAEGAEVPRLPSPDQLRPWSCVVADALVAYPQAQQADPSIPSQWRVDLDTEGGLRYQLWFVHGLLQTSRRQ